MHHRLLKQTLTLAAALLCAAPLLSAQPNPIKIGAILPLSGSGAFWGENARAAISMAAADWNSALAPNAPRLEVIFEDDRCDPKTAVTAFKKLTELDHVRYVIGAICSSATLAIAPLAESAKTVMITPCSEADAISQAGDFIFRTWTPNGRQARVMAAYAREQLHLKRAAVLSVQNDFGESMADSFSKEFTKRGGEIVSAEEYTADSEDLRPQLLRIKSKNPEALYLASYIPDGLRGVRQIRELGIKTRLLATSALNSPDFINAAPDRADGLMLSDLVDASTPEFRTRFSARTNREWPGVSSCASVAYDDIDLLAHALQSAGDDPVRVKNYLYALRKFPGVSGPITFDRNGDLTREHAVFEIRGGKLEPAP